MVDPRDSNSKKNTPEAEAKKATSPAKNKNEAAKPKAASKPKVETKPKAPAKPKAPTKSKAAAKPKVEAKPKAPPKTKAAAKPKVPSTLMEDPSILELSVSNSSIPIEESKSVEEETITIEETVLPIILTKEEAKAEPIKTTKEEVMTDSPTTTDNAQQEQVASGPNVATKVLTEDEIKYPIASQLISDLDRVHVRTPRN